MRLLLVHGAAVGAIIASASLVVGRPVGVTLGQLRLQPVLHGEARGALAPQLLASRPRAPPPAP
jgi:hypothetical protein